MECKYCCGLMMDIGLYPIVKCSVCGKVGIDWNEVLYGEMKNNYDALAKSQIERQDRPE